MSGKFWDQQRNKREKWIANLGTYARPRACTIVNDSGLQRSDRVEFQNNNNGILEFQNNNNGILEFQNNNNGILEFTERNDDHQSIDNNSLQETTIINQEDTEEILRLCESIDAVMPNDLNEYVSLTLSYQQI